MSSCARFALTLSMCLVSKNAMIFIYLFIFLPSHELPHQRQGERRIAVVQVRPADADQGELGHFAEFHGVVAVLQLDG